MSSSTLYIHYKNDSATRALSSCRETSLDFNVVDVAKEKRNLPSYVDGVPLLVHDETIYRGTAVFDFLKEFAKLNPKAVVQDANTSNALPTDIENTEREEEVTNDEKISDADIKRFMSERGAF